MRLLPPEKDLLLGEELDPPVNIGFHILARLDGHAVICQSSHC